MEFIYFEALDENEDIDFNVESNVSHDDMSSFIDDSEKNEDVCKYHRSDNVTRSAENPLEDAFIQKTELENNIINFCENSDNEFLEVGEFKN